MGGAKRRRAAIGNSFQAEKKNVSASSAA